MDALYVEAGRLVATHDGAMSAWHAAIRAGMCNRDAARIVVAWGRQVELLATR